MEIVLGDPEEFSEAQRERLRSTVDGQDDNGVQ